MEFAICANLICPFLSICCHSSVLNHYKNVNKAEKQNWFPGECEDYPVVFLYVLSWCMCVCVGVYMGS